MRSWEAKKASGALEAGGAPDRDERGRVRPDSEDEEDIYHVEDSDEEVEPGSVGGTRVEMDETGAPKYIAHVPVPSQKDVRSIPLSPSRSSPLMAVPSRSSRPC